jgi:hypothetical protein
VQPFICIQTPNAMPAPGAVLIADFWISTVSKMCRQFIEGMAGGSKARVLRQRGRSWRGLPSNIAAPPMWLRIHCVSSPGRSESGLSEVELCLPIGRMLPEVLRCVG